MSRLRRGASLWIDRYRGDVPRAVSLHGAYDADVVIVGGGITGCAAARRLAARGARVVLLEAARFGRGSTAASTALLMQEPDVDFEALAERYGRSAARQIWAMSRRAVNSLTRTLRSFSAHTGVRQLPSVYFTREGGEIPALKRELAARHRAGIPGSWLRADRLREITGVHGAGAILTHGNAQVDPYRACLAFAAAAARGGARLFQHSRVRRIRSSRTSVDV